MQTFLFRCPVTYQKTQGWIADEGDDDDTYYPFTCIACQRAHAVNPKTGHVLGAKNE